MIARMIPNQADPLGDAFDEYHRRQGLQDTPLLKHCLTIPDDGKPAGTTVFMIHASKRTTWADNQCPCCLKRPPRKNPDARTYLPRLAEHFRSIPHIAYQFGVSTVQLTKAVRAAEGITRQPRKTTRRRKRKKVDMSLSNCEQKVQHWMDQKAAADKKLKVWTRRLKAAQKKETIQ